MINNLSFTQQHLFDIRVRACTCGYTFAVGGLSLPNNGLARLLGDRRNMELFLRLSRRQPTDDLRGDPPPL